MSTASSSPILNNDIQALIVQAQAGDSTALETLCARMYPQVERLVHQSMSRDIRGRRPWLSALFSTGDVVQEVFLGVLHDLEDIRGQSEPALLSYIATLTKNRIVDAIRFYEATRRDRRRVTEQVDCPVNPVAEPKGGPDEAAVTQEQILRFHQALASFPERDRALLRERIEHRTPFDQIAEMLGYASADSTRKAFHVAQARLLLRLKSR